MGDVNVVPCMVFGFIVTLICPLLFGIQYILLGLCITNQTLNKQALKHVINSMITQWILILDLSVFDAKDGNKIENSWRCFKVAIGYFFYVLPMGLVGYLFLFIRYKSFICNDLQAPFLLDNTQKSTVNMTELYELRMNYGLE